MPMDETSNRKRTRLDRFISIDGIIARPKTPLATHPIKRVPCSGPPPSTAPKNHDLSPSSKSPGSSVANAAGTRGRRRERNAAFYEDLLSARTEGASPERAKPQLLQHSWRACCLLGRSREAWPRAGLAKSRKTERRGRWRVKKQSSDKTF